MPDGANIIRTDVFDSRGRGGGREGWWEAVGCSEGVRTKKGSECTIGSYDGSY